MMTVPAAVPGVMGHREVIKLLNEDMNGAVIVGTHPINAMELGNTKP
jgi:hypothetical protein